MTRKPVGEVENTLTSAGARQGPGRMTQVQPASTQQATSPRVRRFTSALRELGRARDVDETLQLMVDLASEVVRGVDFADVMFVRSGQISTPIASHETAVALDQIQQDTGEGPCLSAAFDEAEVVVSHDLQQDDRWPAFASRAVDLGIRSVVAHRLFDGRERHNHLGALNMFGTTAGIDDFDLELGGAFAAHCSAVLTGAIEEEGLQVALQSRDVIGQAKGILMERHRLTPDQAHTMLRQASMDRNVKVRDLAQSVTETGALPDDTGS